MAVRATTSSTQESSAHYLAGTASRRQQTLVRLVSSERHLHRPALRGFEPPTDLYETDDEVVVRMEIAGLKTDTAHLSIAVQDQVLTIAGTREDPAAGQRRKYDQIEIFTGPFFRTLSLPCEVDEPGAAASYDDGFLVIVLPKLIRPRPTRTTVVIR